MMTVKQLIERLSNYPGEAIVVLDVANVCRYPESILFLPRDEDDDDDGRAKLYINDYS